jgi:hemin uptake protein HemP
MTKPDVPGANAPDRAAPASAEEARPEAPVPSAELLRGGKCVEISHNGLIYRLQATRLGKLILTK